LGENCISFKFLTVKYHHDPFEISRISGESRHAAQVLCEAVFDKDVLSHTVKKKQEKDGKNVRRM
jgi:hypothetical protein